MKAALPVHSRRSLLRIGGALAGATLATPALARMTPPPRDVLVLGAGMAGLTAALALLRRGHRVTILEHQDRVGGRVLSLPLPDGMASEAGAGHFRGNMPWVLAYARHFGLPLIALNDGLPRYLVNGRVADAADLAAWPWPLHPQERRVSLSSTLNRYLGIHGLDTLTVLDPRWPDPWTIERLSSLSLSDLLRQAGASEAYVALLGAHAGPYTLASAALRIIPGLAYHFGDQNCYRILGGNERLPRALAAAIGPERIVLGDPVAAIDQGAGGSRSPHDPAVCSAETPWSPPFRRASLRTSRCGRPGRRPRRACSPGRCGATR
ncbi:MAG: FAD-dependent oxidoreductase [Rhodospirillales bacterium]|nr:FAD-dependent oxidoreductase [Rhodospirillales bacterium]